MRRVKAGGGRAAPGRGSGGERKRSPKAQRGGAAAKETATSRSGAGRRRASKGAGGKGSKPAARKGPGPGGRGRTGTKGTSTAGGRMATRGERRRTGTLGGQTRGEPPEDVGGRAPREGLLETEGVSMRAEQDQDRREEKRGTRNFSKASPTAKPRAQGGHGGKEPKDEVKRDTVEPLEPGGELGETREVPAAGSANELPGRAPRTRIEHHNRGRGPEGSRGKGLEGPNRAGGRPGGRGEAGAEE